MDKEFTFREFVDQLTSKLDSIHGNKGANMYELTCQYGYVEDREEVDKIKELEELYGESLWHVDKGGNALYDFWKSKGIKENKLCFEQDVRVYFAGHYSYEIYINVPRIILPPKKKVEANKKERIYIFRGRLNKEEFCSLYYLPYLKYPSSIKDFMKWLGTKKKMKFQDVTLWNYDDKLTIKEEKWPIDDKGNKVKKIVEKPNISLIRWGGLRFIKNIKMVEEIKVYNEWLMTDYKAWIENVANPELSKNEYTKTFIRKDLNERLKALQINPTKVEITQEIIQEFCDSENNRFKIQRG